MALDSMPSVGQPVDIASSAYQYRADRKAEDNPPESWLAVMRFAGQPLNKPLDTDAPEIKRILCGLLWEEIRPVQQLELTWTSDGKRRPAPEELIITTLDNQGSASSWWNNLHAAGKPVKPTVSSDGAIYVYDIKTPTCGIVISAGDAKKAADYEIPRARVLVADVWKKMEVEIEWGFDTAAADKDYSGRIETYDGVLAGLRSLDRDGSTTAADAEFVALGRERRRPSRYEVRPAVHGRLRSGGRCNLSQVSRTMWRDTIVTLWTKSGNFSFLAADLENGPILAPEYGFFVRRISELAPHRPHRHRICMSADSAGRRR